MKMKIIACFILAAFQQWCLGQTATNAAAPGEPAPTNWFAVYLFKDYEDLEASALNWKSRPLAATPVVSGADLVSYNFTNHLLTFTPEAARRFSKFHISHLTEPFVVAADGGRIYRGAFVSAACSQSIPLPSITLWGGGTFNRDTNLPANSLFLERTYAAPFIKTDPDPRSDYRIKRAFEELR
jgi:hypothetical protein